MANIVNKIIRETEDDCFGERGAVYYINKDKRTVACTLVGCEDDALSMIGKYGNGILRPYFNDALIKDIYTGIAKCAPEDEFDEKIGMKLALKRAQNKRKGDINVAARNYIRRVREVCDVIERKIANKPAED